MRLELSRTEAGRLVPASKAGWKHLRGGGVLLLPAGSESSEEEEKLDLSSARRLTDEELMRACGGRTAHKGARHGLTMSAKLARLEEQERAFLATYQDKERQREPPESSPPAERQEVRKKKRKQSRDGADAEVLQSQELSEEEVAGEEGKAVKRKKKKNQELSGEEEVAGEEGKAVKRKKKKNQELSGEEEVAGEEGKAVKRKKKKNQELSGEEEVAGEEGKAVKRKKKKNQELSGEEQVAEEGKAAKRKKKQQGEEDKEEPAETEVPLEDTDGPDQAGHSPRKKRKKRKREPVRAKAKAAVLRSCWYHLAMRVLILPAGADGCPRVLRALLRWSPALWPSRVFTSWGCWAGTGWSGAGSSFISLPEPPVRGDPHSHQALGQRPVCRGSVAEGHKGNRPHRVLKYFFRGMNKSLLQ
ncbi:PREDICTED: G patch domain-containing protein 4 [Pygoscelis adeliae]|uniref:G patch domain-containing protein 4 n=1 Tax=Pygoscelis adeliae TaxID=9238 RepID=UPI0004F4EC61|nr:PREDICTED: G patch domain-containing protein 4 [Pygoscelis adeliae]